MNEIEKQPWAGNGGRFDGYAARIVYYLDDQFQNYHTLAVSCVLGHRSLTTLCSLCHCAQRLESGDLRCGQAGCAGDLQSDIGSSSA